MTNSSQEPMAHSLPQPLRQEYEAQQALFAAQPVLVQRFLENQARLIADSITRNTSQVRFTLPDRVVMDSEKHANSVSVPADSRDQVTGNVIDRLARADTRTLLRQRLVELEGSSRKSVAVSAQLMRFAVAHFLVYSILPTGKTVRYSSAEGEEIPSLPAAQTSGPESAITMDSDAIAEEGDGRDGRGELQVPFVPEARAFFLPQWVAFGGQNQLLVNSVEEAEAHVASMQHFLNVLHVAVSMAPYFVADSEYQRKRYGMLGQLVNQGRALAHYQNQEMIRIIDQRSASHDLNRGLSLSVPYFDDQALEMHTRDFVVIPAGRILFVPAFVVHVAREEEAKVAQDTRLSPSTRKYLLAELEALESAFTIE